LEVKIDFPGWVKEISWGKKLQIPNFFSVRGKKSKMGETQLPENSWTILIKIGKKRLYKRE